MTKKKNVSKSELTALRRLDAVKELNKPEYVFAGSIVDVLKENKLSTKADAKWVIDHSNFEMPKGSKKFVYEQMETRKRKLKEMS